MTNKNLRLALAGVALLGTSVIGMLGTTPAAHAGPGITTTRITSTVVGTVQQQTVATQWVNVATPWSTFAPIADGYFAQGLRAVSIATTLGSDGQVLYTAVFHSDQGNDAQWIKPAQPWPDFAQTADDYFNQGLRLVSISTVADADGQVLYTGVFRGGQGNGGQWVNQAQTRQDFYSTMDYYQGHGLHLIATATARGSDGQDLFTGLFRSGPGTDSETREATSYWGEFANHTDYEFSKGYRVIAISTFMSIYGWVRYSVIYGAAQGTQWVLSARPWADFAAADGQYFSQGLRLVSVGLATADDGQILYTGVWRSI